MWLHDFDVWNLQNNTKITFWHTQTHTFPHHLPLCTNSVHCVDVWHIARFSLLSTNLSIVIQCNKQTNKHKLSPITTLSVTILLSVLMSDTLHDSPYSVDLCHYLPMYLLKNTPTITQQYLMFCRHFTQDVPQCPISAHFTQDVPQCPISAHFTQDVPKCPISAHFTQDVPKCPISAHFTQDVPQCPISAHFIAIYVLHFLFHLHQL